MSRPIRLNITPEFEKDVQNLAAAAARNPGGPQEIILTQTLARLKEIQAGTRPKRPLQAMASYPDLSDCYKVHIWSTNDDNVKPSHRLVWREGPDPERRGGILREPVLVGPRENGNVYQKAGQRLGRPVGVTLEQLRFGAELMEPPQHRAPDATQKKDSGYEF